MSAEIAYCEKPIWTACASRARLVAGVAMRAGMPDGRRSRRHVAHDDGVGADLGAVADQDGSQDLGAGADDDAAPERRVALALVPGRAAQRNAVIERRIVADLRRLADHDSHAVVDENAPADRRAGVDLDSRQPAAPVRQPARQPAEVRPPQAVDDRAMPDQRVQSRIAGKNLPGRARGRIAVEHDARCLLAGDRTCGHSGIPDRNAQVFAPCGQRAPRSSYFNRIDAIIRPTIPTACATR